MTKYKVLRRLTSGQIMELGEHETNGPEQAMRAQHKESGKLAPGETFIAVPVGNWTEQGARLKVIETIELFDPAIPSTLGLKDDSV